MAQNPTPATVYLGLGSNVDAATNLRSALKHLQAEFGEVELSPVYRSKAVGFSGDDFLNACCCIQTDMGPGQLKHWLAELENRHGR
ncbi:MAG: 2-amino-4-hydroxy-6-hydroxymethyldihydropteridine diphosphokinase, partial [Pseudomonadota bacterium]